MRDYHSNKVSDVETGGYKQVHEVFYFFNIIFIIGYYDRDETPP